MMMMMIAIGNITTRLPNIIRKFFISFTFSSFITITSTIDEYFLFLLTRFKKLNTFLTLQKETIKINQFTNTTLILIHS